MSVRMIVATIASIAAAGMAGSAALAQQHTLLERPQIKATPDYSELLRKAEAKARQTLPQFLARWEAQPAGTSDYQVRVGQPSRDRFHNDYFWMTVDALAPDGRIVGRAATDSSPLRQVKAGASIEVSQANVADWMYMSHGRMYGQYTGRVNLWLMPRETSAQLRAVLAPTALEPDTN